MRICKLLVAKAVLAWLAATVALAQILPSTIYVTCDEECVAIYVNEVLVADRLTQPPDPSLVNVKQAAVRDETSTPPVQITSTGTNVIAIRARAALASPNAVTRGVLAELDILEDGAITTVLSSTEWKVFVTAIETDGPNGWQTISFDDSSWSQASSLGSYFSEVTTDGSLAIQSFPTPLSEATSPEWIWADNTGTTSGGIFLRLAFTLAPPEPECTFLDLEPSGITFQGALNLYKLGPETEITALEVVNGWSGDVAAVRMKDWAGSDLLDDSRTYQVYLTLNPPTTNCSCPSPLVQYSGVLRRRNFRAELGPMSGPRVMVPCFVCV